MAWKNHESWEKKVGRRRRRKRTRMCDLPADLVAQEILTRVPITSLGAVRSTCKLWDSLSKGWIFGKAAAARRQQFLGFMTKDSKVCSVRFHLCGSSSKDDEEDEDEEDLLDLSVKQVDLLNQVKISRVFHCDGLLLCVAKDHPSLLMWNPYLGQTQWIGFTTCFNSQDCFALGYDINRNHKILRLSFLDVYGQHQPKMRYGIFEFSSNSWKVLKVTLTPNCEIEPYHGGVSLKGNTYFHAREFRQRFHEHKNRYFPSNITTAEDKDFLLCFDFTTERFGPRLPLPFHNDLDDTVALSSVKGEKLAVLYQQKEGTSYALCDIVQIWVTTTIEVNHVSWSQFLRVEITPFALTALRGIRFCSSLLSGGSFFIDEEEKVAVVFDFNGYIPRKETCGVSYHKAFVIGEKYVSVEVGAPKHYSGSPHFCRLLVCSSSYLPSLVQLSQPHKGQVPPPPPPTLVGAGKAKIQTSSKK